MAKRMYRARLYGLTPQVQAALERTHYVFVECLRQMVERYLHMRKGKYGAECRQLTEFMLGRSNTFAHGVMDKLSRPTWQAKIEDDWVRRAREIVALQGPLFDQHQAFAVVDGVTVHTKPQGKAKPSPGRLAVIAKFWRQVCDSASAHVKASQELMNTWRTERADWLRKKQTWEDAHPEFVVFWNGPYAEFERVCQAARETAQLAAGQDATHKKTGSRARGKRIHRWHLWYEWIVSHPEIVEWRGRAKAAAFKAVPPEVAAQIKAKHARQDKQIGKLLAWLEENNPELQALNGLRRTYVREFLRFNRPPTLTLPSPVKHPYWFTLERGRFYRAVDFEAGTAELLLIDKSDDDVWFLQWLPVRMQCDPRLVPSRRAALFSAKGRCPPYIEGSTTELKKDPPKSPQERKAAYAGAKLVIRSNRKELLFTVEEQDGPPRAIRRKAKEWHCPADGYLGPGGQRQTLRILAVDLGIRHIGAYALVEGCPDDDRWQTRSLAKGFIQNGSIPSLGAIRQHDWALRAGRRQRGKPVTKDDRSFVELQDHRTSMAEDRFKKAANCIVELARHHDVHLVVFEELSDLNPTAFDERWMNRQLRDMNRRKIVEATKDGCTEFGILCKDDIGAWYTSHVCSKCLRPGWRFSMQRKQSFKEHVPRAHCEDYGYPVWDQGGHLFRCPHCRYSANADVNAAGNLAAKFFGRWRKVTRKDWKYTWEEDGQAMIFNARASFEQWAASAKCRQELRDSPF